MFYSHEGLQDSIAYRSTRFDFKAVLTSRKYGVATIWYVSSALSEIPPRYSHDLCRLVATLGQTSSLKKVSRKAILQVNVPKACESILMPEAPLALRLQSNLLYALIARILFLSSHPLAMESHACSLNNAVTCCQTRNMRRTILER